MALEDCRVEAVSLACVPGSNRSEIARRFGVSRKTLYKWLVEHGHARPLVDRSRRPHTSPRRTCEEVELAVVVVRETYGWGGRKISAVLARDFGLRVSASTVTEVLRRHGLLDGPGSGETRDWQRFEREHPNELWQMDYKGHFATLVEGRCHPFICIDDCSRYNLSLLACPNERTQTVSDCLTLAFRTYGMPLAILCDNGGCWGGGKELTALGLWLSRLGVEVKHGKPYHPQTQGKLERLNRTVQSDVLDGRHFRDLTECQRAFDRFRADYNQVRPHESLEDRTPASRYRLSSIPFPEGPLPEPEYLDVYEVRRVQHGGIVHFRGKEYVVGYSLKGKRVGIRAIDDGVFEVRYGRTKLRSIDLREGPG